jgi:branched-chain amino acid transport system ATP-binding protein
MRMVAPMSTPVSEPAGAPAPVRALPGGCLLDITGLSVYYGNIAAVKGLSLAVGRKEIVTLIGSNGAGKSTTLRTISGLIRPREGDIVYEGSSIVTMAGHRIVAAGICHSPEGRRIFPRMTVRENLDLGAFLRHDKERITTDLARVLDLFPRLKERIGQKAGTLSGGEQQMLAVGRALMGSPTLLLLDEPSMGLAPVLVDLIFETVQTIRDQGTTVLLVEQNALAALRVADYAYVLESGSLKLEGPAGELAEDPEVVKAYLGG